MDENKKIDELNPEVENEDTNEDVEDRAAKILSGLKDSKLPDAVQDWDGVLPENKDELEIIEEEVHIIDEIKEAEEEEDIPEEELCVICGKRRRCTSISEDYEYCAQCRIQLLKRPYNGMGIAALVLVFIIFFGVSLLGIGAPNAGFFSNIAIGGQTLIGYILEQKGDLSGAAKLYDEAIVYSQTFKLGTSMSLVRRSALVVEKNEGPDNASAAITLLVGTETAKGDKVLADIIKRGEDFEEAYNSLTEAIYPYYNEDTGDLDIDKSYAAIDKLVAENEGKFDEDTVSYFKAFVAVFRYDTDKIIKYREEVRKRSPEKFWLYNDGNGLLDAYMEKGEYETAVKVADEILKYNSTNPGANKTKAHCALINGDKDTAEEIIKVLEKNDSSAITANSIKALMMRLDGKYDEVVEFCTDEIDDDNYDAETYYQNMVAMLLKGEYENAYNMAAEYGSLFQNGIGSQDDYTKFIYIYILTTYLVDQEEYKLLEADFKQQGATLAFPEEFEQYKEGKLTLEDIFLKGDFELR